MKALVTGASSGIGFEISKYLYSLGYDIIAVARDLGKLNTLKEECDGHVEVIIANLSEKEEVYKVYEKTKNQDIDILVNNAGFGAFGKFEDIPLDKELDMIGVNVEALHILTKLFLRQMKERNGGKILNIGSIAGFVPGPLMATYYSTKAYVYRFTQSIYKELRKEKSNVSITVCCPGPVSTNFNNVANVKFSMKPKTSNYVAKKAVDNMLKGKLLALTGFKERVVHTASKLVPDSINAEFVYHIQQKKKKNFQ